MADKIIIHDLRIECIVGVFEDERTRTQPVLLDIELEVDAAEAAAREDLEGLLDYYRVTNEVRDLVIESRFKLIESMAEGVARLCTDRFGVANVRVRVKKPGALTDASHVSVEIERGAAVAGKGAR